MESKESVEVKKRSDAQRAADARYEEKRAGKNKKVSFTFSAKEADEINEAIKSSGMSKVDFLRKAIEAYKQGKF